MKEFYKDNTASVYYDHEIDTLVLKYLGKVSNDEQFILINSAVLEAFQSLNTQKFVADIQKMGIISLKSQQWVLQNLLPGMISHLKGKKLFHAQLLDKSEILSKVSAGNIKNKSKEVAKDFEVVQFYDEGEMRDFLINWK
jgi:hypothetical protein